MIIKPMPKRIVVELIENQPLSSFHLPEPPSSGKVLMISDETCATIKVGDVAVFTKYLVLHDNIAVVEDRYIYMKE